MLRKSAFYAYPADGANVRSAIKAACEQLRGLYPELEIIPWEELSTGGKIIIDEICSEIDRCDLFIADLTRLNWNVLFELGYAIAIGKQIWLTADERDTVSKDLIARVAMIATLGRCNSVNAAEIVTSFKRDLPHLRNEKTLYDEFILNGKNGLESPKVFVGRQTTDTQQVSEVLSVVDQSGLDRVVLDPNEESGYSLSWCLTNISTSDGVLLFFSSPDREDAHVSNATNSFIAGLSVGTRRGLLMVAEPEFVAPFDYKDRIVRSRKNKICVERSKSFLEEIKTAYRPHNNNLGKSSHELGLVDLDIGDFVAENEYDTLRGVFIKTHHYREVLRGQSRVCVGRRGSGKSAIMMMAFDELSANSEDLTIRVQSPDLDFVQLTKTMSQVPQADTTGVMIAIWKFLILGEVANAHGARIQANKARSESDDRFLQYLTSHAQYFSGSMGSRLSYALDMCRNGLLRDSGKRGAGPNELSQHLFATLFNNHRKFVSEHLGDYHRVRVLIDNLDRNWEHRGPNRSVIQFFLALLSVADNFGRDISGPNVKPHSFVSITVFLRKDVFDVIRRESSEPDKLSSSEIDWGANRAVLLEIVQRRIMSSLGSGATAEEAWQRFFPLEIAGQKLSEYVLSSVFHRPREVLYFFRVAIESALRRGEVKLEGQDFRRARNEYFFHVLRGLVAESGFKYSEIEDLVLSFYACREPMEYKTVKRCVVDARKGEAKVDEIINELCRVGFLCTGLQTETIDYFSTGLEYDVLDKKLKTATRGNIGMRVFDVAPTFKSIMEGIL